MDVVVNGGLLGRNESGKNQVSGHTADWQYWQISERLEQIRQYLEKEIDQKQRTIELQQHEIELLKKEIEHKTTDINGLHHQLQQCTQNTEGHRQLINKLLHDIEHYQNDIEWYKRTYERRSLWGVLKERWRKRPEI
jgi:septal ring factor EnvC (AmiA/AmiB activator)